MPDRAALGRAATLLATTVAYGAVGFGMIVTALAAPDQSRLVLLRWLLLAVWTLVLPPVWGVRLARRLARLDARPASGAADRHAALGGLWLELGALGLGAAVAALAVIRSYL